MVFPEERYRGYNEPPSRDRVEDEIIAIPDPGPLAKVKHV
jgi:hypothetical protein